MKINPGTLNKKIEIFELVSGVDSAGFPIDSVRKVIRRPWASFSRTSGTRVIQYGGEFEQTDCRFVIRSGGTRITDNMRIEYAGEIYEILYANDYYDGHEYTEIIARKVVLR